MFMRITIFIIFFLYCSHAWSQVTNIVIPDEQEQVRFKNIIASNIEARSLYHFVATAATAPLKHVQLPLDNIHYEGLFDMDPLRKNTVKSFPDNDYVAHLRKSGFYSFILWQIHQKLIRFLFVKGLNYSIC